MIFNSIIPLPFYAPLFYHGVFALALVLFIKLHINGFTLHFQKQKELSALVLLFFVTMYMGMRPISYVFGDMGMYNHVFNYYLNAFSNILFNEAKCFPVVPSDEVADTSLPIYFTFGLFNISKTLFILGFKYSHDPLFLCSS